MKMEKKNNQILMVALHSKRGKILLKSSFFTILKLYEIWPTFIYKKICIL